MSEILDIEQTLAIIDENSQFIKSDCEFAFATLMVKKFRNSLNNIPALTINLAYKHQDLFEYISSVLQVYPTLGDLPETDKYIIYIQTLSLWAISETIEAIHRVISEYKLEMYEIVMDNSKIVLICEKNQETLQLIRDNVRELFNEMPRIDRTDANVDQVIINNQAGKNPIEVLNIVKKNIGMLKSTKIESIGIKPFETCGKSSFHKIRINPNKNDDIMNLPDFKKYMGVVVSDIHGQNITININQTIKQKTPKKDDKKIITEEWVRANPPTEFISRSDYYQKYKNYMLGRCPPTNENQLGKILRKIYGSENVSSPKKNGSLGYELINQ